MADVITGAQITWLMDGGEFQQDYSYSSRLTRKLQHCQLLYKQQIQQLQSILKRHL
jgi:hypothetical protein